MSGILVCLLVSKSCANRQKKPGARIECGEELLPDHAAGRVVRKACVTVRYPYIHGTVPHSDCSRYVSRADMARAGVSGLEPNLLMHCPAGSDPMPVRKDRGLLKSLHN